MLAALFAAETLSFLAPRSGTEVAVAAQTSELLRVTFNISFPALPCHLLALEVTDVRLPPLRARARPAAAVLSAHRRRAPPPPLCRRSASARRRRLAGLFTAGR